MRRALTLTLILLGLLLPLGLGIWQLQRLAWKQALVTRIGERVAAAPLPLASIAAEVRAGAAAEYRPVFAEGSFRHDRELYAFATDEAGRPGWHVITPLVTDSGTVLVNRGFVPEALREPATRGTGQTVGRQRVTGLIRTPEQPGWFVPANNPQRNNWFWRDIAGLAEAASSGNGATNVASTFLIDADATANPGGWPRGGTTRINLPNRHLEYALTWFALAATYVVIVGLAMRQVRRRGS